MDNITLEKFTDSLHLFIKDKLITAGICFIIPLKPSVWDNSANSTHNSSYDNQSIAMCITKLSNQSWSVRWAHDIKQSIHKFPTPEIITKLYNHHITTLNDWKIVSRPLYQKQYDSWNMLLKASTDRSSIQLKRNRVDNDELTPLSLKTSQENKRRALYGSKPSIQPDNNQLAISKLYQYKIETIQSFISNSDTKLKHRLSYFNPNYLSNVTSSTDTINLASDKHQIKNITIANHSNQSESRYHLILKIGEGTFGQVYIANDQFKKVLVCIKETRLTYSKDRGIHLTIVRELQIGTIIRHPNLLPIINYSIQFNGTCQIIMPLISHDLPGLVRQWRTQSQYWHPLRTIPWIKCIFSQLLEGLSYLHKHSIMHRDIKLNNVLIQSNGTAMLCDYGWSRIMSCNPGRHTYPPFTIVYRSIELLYGIKSYSTPADIWAMGCLLIEMICYKPLFPSDSVLDSISLISQALGSLPPGLYKNTNISNTNKSFLNPEQRAESMKRYIQHKTSSIDIIDDSFITFILKMICYNPASRYTADQLLKDPWLCGNARGTSGSVKPSTLDSFMDILPTNNTYRLLDKAEELGISDELKINLTDKL